MKREPRLFFVFFILCFCSPRSVRSFPCETRRLGCNAHCEKPVFFCLFSSAAARAAWRLCLNLPKEAWTIRVSTISFPPNQTNARQQTRAPPVTSHTPYGYVHIPRTRACRLTPNVTEASNPLPPDMRVPIPQGAAHPKSREAADV